MKWKALHKRSVHGTHPPLPLLLLAGVILLVETELGLSLRRKTANVIKRPTAGRSWGQPKCATSTACTYVYMHHATNSALKPG